MDVDDFVVEVAVTIPNFISGDLWTACITTRGITPEAYERGVPLRGHHVCFNQHAAWFHSVTREGSEASGLLYESRANNIHTDLGQTNHVRIVAIESKAFFFINEEYIDELDFGRVLKSGAVGLSVTAFPSTAGTKYANFKIVPLKKVFGPASGKFEPVDGIDAYSPRSVLADGVIQAGFHKPYTASEGDWGSGFVFRSDLLDEFHFLAVHSSGNWYHFLRTGDVDTEQELKQQYSNHIATGGGDSNHIRIIALGGEGWLFINSAYIDKLDLSGLTQAGRVSAIGAYYADDDIAGYSTRFEDFTIWSAD